MQDVEIHLNLFVYKFLILFFPNSLEVKKTKTEDHGFSVVYRPAFWIFFLTIWNTFTIKDHQSGSLTVIDINYIDFSLSFFCS